MGIPCEILSLALVWSGLVWFGLVGLSFNASLEPQRKAQKRARLAEDALAHNTFGLVLVWFGLVGFSFNASLEPQPRARRRARLAEDAPALWFGDFSSLGLADSVGLVCPMCS